MKKVLIMLLAVLLLGAGSAFAEDISIDVSGGIATSPTDDPISVGTGFGGGIGMTYGLSNVVKNLAARADVSYAAWSKDKPVSGLDKLKMSGIPIFVGARYKAPNKSPVEIFGEAGLEISMDKSEETTPSFTVLGVTYGGKVETSETNFGAGVGAGVSYPINKMLSAGASARFHLKNDSYLSAGVFLSYNIGKNK